MVDVPPSKYSRQKPSQEFGYFRCDYRNKNTGSGRYGIKEVQVSSFLYPSLRDRLFLCLRLLTDSLSVSLRLGVTRFFLPESTSIYSKAAVICLLEGTRAGPLHFYFFDRNFPEGLSKIKSFPLCMTQFSVADECMSVKKDLFCRELPETARIDALASSCV